MNLLEITIGDGKYTIIQAKTGGTRALRYGEPWRDLTGDQFILALGYEIERLRESLQRIYDLEPDSPPAVEYLFEAAQQIAKEALNPQP